MKSNLGDYEEKEDRISSFPDEILSHILSFMPTKYAFRTSVLSTRWKPLWTSVPIIDLDSYICFNEDPSSTFMDFVDRVMVLYNLPTIIKFHLRCSGYYNPNRLISCICTAIKLNVQELVLNFENIKRPVELPQSVFTSACLVVLKLAWAAFLQFPMPVFLPNLKVLHLHNLKYLDDDSFENLLSGCPVLEELDMWRNGEDYMQTLCICSSTLKKLHILCCGFNLNEENFHYGVVIKTPALEILGLGDHLTRDFDVDEFPSLVNANLNVSYPDSGNKTSDDYCNSVGGMLRKMSDVQHLTIHLSTLMVVTQASAYKLPLFNNLLHLHINSYDVPWLILPDLLGRMPNLKVLIFVKCPNWCSTCSWYTASENVPKCLSFSLETIEFGGFVECEPEMKLVSFLLENAMVLKKFTIKSHTMNENTKTHILKFPRSSSTCEIELCDYVSHQE